MPPLPPGQHEIPSFPRFGLAPMATRFPHTVDRIPLLVRGDVETEVELGTELAILPRVEQRSDFHCVTTWTKRGLVWGGWRFADFYRELVLPRARPLAGATFVILRGQDGARTSMELEDLLAPEVLLADQLHGQPLPVEHGAPLRLVAPAHYAYKSAKHLDRIELWRSRGEFRPFGPAFMAHPRARVALEERGQWVPGWLLRWIYRPLIGPTARKFARELARHQAAPRS